MNVITDRFLCSWIRCKRKAWLDLHENSNRKIWTSHRTLQLDHQHKSLLALNPLKPARGVKGCEEGAITVSGLRIKGFIANHKVECHPLMIQRVKGTSIWGNFAYQPIIVRQGRKITKEHIQLLAFWLNLLNQLQEGSLKSGLAISLRPSGLEKEEVIITKKINTQLILSLNKLSTDLSKKIDLPLANDQKKCILCKWQKLCNKKAVKEGNLSLINGIGAKRKKTLEEIGIRNIDTLANTKSNILEQKLKSYQENNNVNFIRLIHQAKVHTTEKPQKLSEVKILNQIINSQGFLIYDIESDPDENHDFLHGFLPVEKDIFGNFCPMDGKYLPILNLNKNQEIDAWLKIQKTIDQYPNFPILHYGETESLSIVRLAQRQGTNEEEIKKIQNRLIDMHKVITARWILPVHSYGLKPIAHWIGFHWSQGNVDGAKALLWWRQRDKNMIESANLLKILQYNLDDCKATWKIMEWLMDKT